MNEQNIIKDTNNFIYTHPKWKLYMFKSLIFIYLQRLRNKLYNLY